MNGIYKDANLSISKGDFEAPLNYDPIRFQCNETGMGELFDDGEDATFEEFFNGELGLSQVGKAFFCDRKKEAGFGGIRESPKMFFQFLARKSFLMFAFAFDKQTESN